MLAIVAKERHVKRRPKAKAVKGSKPTKPVGKGQASEPVKRITKMRSLIVEARSEGNAVGALLAKITDRHGMSVRAVASNPELLKEAGLNPKDVNPEAIGVANFILNETDKDISARVAAYNERVKPFIKQEPTFADEPGKEILPLYAEPKKKPKREGLFGHKVTAVIRWMGVEGWKFPAAKKALAALGVNIADATIHAQLRAGVKGERGPAAELTASESKKLKEAAK